MRVDSSGPRLVGPAASLPVLNAAALRPPASRAPGDRFEPSSGAATAPKVASAVACCVAPSGSQATVDPTPAPVQTGTLDYYLQRRDDFIRRNPDLPPPTYYAEYGDKYVQRFSELGPRDLSPKGLEWRDKTLVLLQEALEAKRIEDPEAFAQLELDDKAFTRFAYATHLGAYMEAGFMGLPLRDKLRIMRTPDIGDFIPPLWRTQAPEGSGPIASAVSDVLPTQGATERLAPSSSAPAEQQVTWL